MKFENIEVTHISDWIPVADIPTQSNEKYNFLNEQYGTVGIYQVAMSKNIGDIQEDLIHSKIGYTGKSTNLLNRTYSIRQPSGDHGANRYIRQNNLDKSQDVVIRYIYCSLDDYTNLECKIHKKTEELYGYRFEWISASAGNDGNKSTIIDLAEKLTSEEIINIISELKNIAIGINQREFLKKLKEV